ncbi:MAG: ribosome silencing factor [Clostridia bacterium]|nr:ribosome silencing factor [Clostridia bacterium]
MQDIAVTQAVAQKLYDNKANHIVALDVRELTVICDYMVIASGRNANQVKALADDADECMAKLGIPLRRTEGANEGRWIILDYGHIIVHIFHQEERQFYNLERLWEDGKNRLVLPFDQTVLD